MEKEKVGVWHAGHKGSETATDFATCKTAFKTSSHSHHQKTCSPRIQHFK